MCIYIYTHYQKLYCNMLCYTLIMYTHTYIYIYIYIICILASTFRIQLCSLHMCRETHVRKTQLYPRWFRTKIHIILSGRCWHVGILAYHHENKAYVSNMLAIIARIRYIRLLNWRVKLRNLLRGDSSALDGGPGGWNLL